MIATPPEQIRRIVYLGSPDLAVPPLRALHEAGLDIALVVTRPDRRRGRGGAAQPTPVKAAALDLGLRVGHDVEEVTEVGADLGVVVAYGRIIPAVVLDVVPMVNIHFSLLPRWRGAAPVERALLAGDTRTGVCLMAVEEGLDTGAVYRSDEVDIAPTATLDSLREELVDLGTRQLVTALRDGLGEPEPQTGEITYADKIDPAELEIDWRAPTATIDRLVRLGGAWTTLEGRRLKIHEGRPGGDRPGEPGTVGLGDDVVVATDDGGFALTVVQPEGKARTDVADWRNGARLGPGTRLGS